MLLEMVVEECEKLGDYWSNFDRQVLQLEESIVGIFNIRFGLDVPAEAFYFMEGNTLGTLNFTIDGHTFRARKAGDGLFYFYCNGRHVTNISGLKYTLQRNT